MQVKSSIDAKAKASYFAVQDVFFKPPDMMHLSCPNELSTGTRDAKLQDVLCKDPNVENKAPTLMYYKENPPLPDYTPTLELTLAKEIPPTSLLEHISATQPTKHLGKSLNRKSFYRTNLLLLSAGEPVSRSKPFQGGRDDEGTVPEPSATDEGEPTRPYPELHPHGPEELRKPIAEPDGTKDPSLKICRPSDHKKHFGRARSAPVRAGSGDASQHASRTVPLAYGPTCAFSAPNMETSTILYSLEYNEDMEKPKPASVQFKSPQQSAKPPDSLYGPNQPYPEPNKETLSTKPIYSTHHLTQPPGEITRHSNLPNRANSRPKPAQIRRETKENPLSLTGANHFHIFGNQDSNPSSSQDLDHPLHSSHPDRPNQSKKPLIQTSNRIKEDPP